MEIVFAEPHAAEQIPLQVWGWVTGETADGWNVHKEEGRSKENWARFRLGRAGEAQPDYLVQSQYDCFAFLFSVEE